MAAVIGAPIAAGVLSIVGTISAGKKIAENTMHHRRLQKESDARIAEFDRDLHEFDLRRMNPQMTEEEIRDRLMPAEPAKVREVELQEIPATPRRSGP